MCICAVNKNTREMVRTANLAYQQATNELIDSGIYDTSDDFTVVRQPFMEHMKVPLTVLEKRNLLNEIIVYIKFILL